MLTLLEMTHFSSIPQRRHAGETEIRWKSIRKCLLALSYIVLGRQSKKASSCHKSLRGTITFAGTANEQQTKKCQKRPQRWRAKHPCVLPRGMEDIQDTAEAPVKHTAQVSLSHLLTLTLIGYVIFFLFRV